MRKILKVIFALLPKRVRFQLIRRMVRIENSFEQENIQVQVATDKEDFERAFQLLHDCYVKSGLMDPHPSGLRCNSYSFLPNTAIIVLKLNHRVIGTVSLIRDSTMGLPSDEKYKDENDKLRTNGKVLTEVSALAIDPEFRNRGHMLTLMLMKYLYNYAKTKSDTDYLICTIHPRAEDFYRALWGFERRGEVVSYNYVKGALAVFMFMEVSEANEKKVLATYTSKDPNRNLGLYCLLEDPRFVYPSFAPGQVLAVPMNPENLNYFFKERTNLFNELTESQKIIFFEIYYFYFKEKGIEKFFHVQRDQAIREYRTPTRILARVTHGNTSFEGQLLDLNANGCFMTIRLSAFSRVLKGDPIQLDFELDSRPFRITGNCRWKSDPRNNLCPVGIGIQFDGHVLRLTEELKNWATVKVHSPRKTG
jgi:hypothetical protein